MTFQPYVLTADDRVMISALLLDFATELDLHYDREDLPALVSSLAIMKDAIALLRRADGQVHPDVLSIVAKFDTSRH